MEKIEIPTQCPNCESTLIRKKDQLYCVNEECSASKIKQLIAYCKSIDIKGLGEKTIEKLGLVDIEDIYSLSLDTIVPILGDKVSAKLMQEIEKSKNIPLDKYISAFSIPLVGISTAKKLDNLYIEDYTYEYLRGVGFGDKAANNLLDFIKNKYIQRYCFLPVTPHLVMLDSVKPIDYTVVVTGAIPGYTRESIKDYLKSKGITVLTSVSAKVTHVICNNRKGSSTEKKAEQLNIPIVKLNEFEETLKND